MNLILIILLYVSLIINCKETFAKQNEILTNHNLATKLFESFNNSNISEKCNATAQFYNQHFNQSWAIQCKSKSDYLEIKFCLRVSSLNKVIDASGNIAPGILRGNLQFMGNFDQCIDIEFEPNNTSDTIHGQYCSFTLPITSFINSNSIVRKINIIDIINII